MENPGSAIFLEQLGNRQRRGGLKNILVVEILASPENSVSPVGAACFREAPTQQEERAEPGPDHSLY